MRPKKHESTCNLFVPGLMKIAHLRTSLPVNKNRGRYSPWRQGADSDLSQGLRPIRIYLKHPHSFDDGTIRVGRCRPKNA
jgi:hypothetical protein